MGVSWKETCRWGQMKTLMDVNVSDGLCVSHLQGVYPLYIYLLYCADEDHEMESKVYKWTSLIALRALTIFCVLYWGKLGYKGNLMLIQYIIDWLLIIYHIIHGYYMMSSIRVSPAAVAVWGAVEMLTSACWHALYDNGNMLMLSVVKTLVFAKSGAEPHGNVINFARFRQKVENLKMEICWPDGQHCY